MNANPTAAQVQTPSRTSVDDRASALIASLENESPSESAAETSTAEQPTSSSPPDVEAGSSAAVSGDAPSPEEQAAAARRQERLARIAAAMEKERKEDAERAQHRQRREKERESTSELERVRARLKELEPLNDVFKDEESFLAAAETRGMSAEKMINYWRKRMTDPQAVAMQQTAHAEKRMLDELAKRDAEIAKLREEIIAKEQAAKEHAEGVSRATQFVHQASALADSHPLAADFLAEHGPQVFITFANEYIAPHLPERYDLDQLHDRLEQFLDRVGRRPRNTAPMTPPANGLSQPPKKNGAEKPVTTLSNAATAERAQVTEQVPLSRLPLDERERRLREKLEREGG